MDSSCLVMAPCGFALFCKFVGEAVEVAGVAAGTEGSVDPPGEVAASDPVDPVAPIAPTGSGAGGTAVGLSHALRASAISTAEDAIEYFMRIPFDCSTRTAPVSVCSHPDSIDFWRQ